MIDNIFRKHKINAVIHTAAEKSLIICENQQEKAYAVNYAASVNLAEITQIKMQSSKKLEDCEEMYR